MAKKESLSQKEAVIIEDALTESDDGAKAIKNNSSYDVNDAVQTLYGDMAEIKKIEDTTSGNDSKKRNTISKVQKLIAQADKKPAVKIFKKIKKNTRRLIK